MSDTSQEKSSGADGFYRAFEDKYRGSRDLIKSRLRIYLPFLDPLKSVYVPAKAIDLGCGRGEWLELLTEEGFEAYGVDLDDGMLAACHERGLQVSRDDAVGFLRSLPDGSRSVVSGFHIAEHLSFSELRILVQEAFRVLKPGGLLILETPNPENLKVSGITFYLDPTHKHPLPPDLLSFLTEYHGFGRVKVVRLQEQAELLKATTASLDDVLGGASPDYAVIAQKSADKALMTYTGRAFEAEYGLTLDQLVNRFDTQLVLQSKQVMKQNEQLVRHSEQARKQEERLALQVARATDLSHALKRLNALLEGELAAKSRVLEAQQVEIARLSDRLAAIREAKHELAAVYSSTSWRIAAPLRSFKINANWVARGIWAWITLKPGSRPRRIARQILIHVPVIRRHWVEPAVPPIEEAEHRSAPEFPASSRPHHGGDPASHALIETWQLELGAEPEGARRIYRRLVQARQSSLSRNQP